MRVVEHYLGGPHKILRVETDGCAVNIVIGLHAESGELFTAIEIEPRLPDQDGMVWELDGPAVTLARRVGAQILPGDSPYEGEPGPEPEVVAPGRGISR